MVDKALANLNHSFIFGFSNRALNVEPVVNDFADFANGRLQMHMCKCHFYTAIIQT
jgi:hypothetical protein